MTYISWSSDFALYLEDCFIGVLNRCGTFLTFISWFSDFALYFEGYLMKNIILCHGPVVLHSVLKSVSWMNIRPWYIESVWCIDWPHNKCHIDQYLMNIDQYLMNIDYILLCSSEVQWFLPCIFLHSKHFSFTGMTWCRQLQQLLFHIEGILT